MITLKSGTPGSGKSLDTCKDVEFWLKTLKKNVISNVQYNSNLIVKNRKEHGRFYYIVNTFLTPDFLYKYALKFHDIGKESQTLIVVDEAQFMFSPTACKLFSKENPRYRQDWLEFYSTHRHLGFDIILVTQFDRLLDPQLRCLLEYNYVHRKANNFKVFGKLLTIFRIKLFVQVQYWYGSKDKSGSKFFIYRKKYSLFYDSYAQREVIIQKLIAKYGEDFVLNLLNINKKDKSEIKEKKEKTKKISL